MNLNVLLEMDYPELYDLKDEKGYNGNDALEKMFNYKSIYDGFDCDGSLIGNGKNHCKLIREIYRILWDWKDIIDENHVKRYAATCINDGLFMGPETMNTFQTTYSRACKLGLRDNTEKYILFANAVGRIGNMTLTYAGFNKYIAYDYWDIKIKRQYLDNISLSEKARLRYINLFFHWDYVNASNSEYSLKPFWNGHEKKYLPEKNEIPNYIDLVDLYTKRRGIFMIGMLNIACKCENDYVLIRNRILMSDNTFSGYEEVINKANALKFCNNETYNTLNKLLNKIETVNDKSNY